MKKRDQPKNKSNTAKVQYKVTITAYDNQYIEVSGFPMDPMLAISLMCEGVNRVATHFVRLAVEGKMVKKSPLIVPAGPRVVEPGGLN